LFYPRNGGCYTPGFLDVLAAAREPTVPAVPEGLPCNS